jgi:hypothetical protein
VRLLVDDPCLLEDRDKRRISTVYIAYRDDALRRFDVAEIDARRRRLRAPDIGSRRELRADQHGESHDNGNPDKTRPCPAATRRRRVMPNAVCGLEISGHQGQSASYRRSHLAARRAPRV